MGKWYDNGKKDALEGLGEDPPMNPGNRAYSDYREGYEDGQRELDSQADYDRVNNRPRRLG